MSLCRSGEEGIYPHLESTAEERLRSLSPNHILLRRAEPVLHIDDVDIKERNSVMRDVAVRLKTLIIYYHFVKIGKFKSFVLELKSDLKNQEKNKGYIIHIFVLSSAY